ncbi:hypothetical protein A2Z00_03735 [Candidatus Gottesmanbacteria bacterium RBG_13_45_10]|uniref:SpoVT-AbrB domain-containing protein n=1 Tax=Candidatus Gottesmanbacteria bacterium RBG_13_45_10 TaxID=1798370 RepID=A0A1F5ZHF3_9BACT|nr:MAG: hypothetical protein A2Z00_03735 [Candidatus Gottesmanbacteria bacterium RBG_13_45_10]
MQTQTIFQVGNSSVVSIPTHIMKSVKFKKGQKVVVNQIPEMDAVLIRPANRETSSKKLSEKEFQSWLKSFMEEDGALLDELAHR